MSLYRSATEQSLRRPRTTMLAIALLFLGFGSQLPRIVVDTDPENMLPADQGARVVPAGARARERRAGRPPLPEGGGLRAGAVRLPGFHQATLGIRPGRRPAHPLAARRVRGERPGGAVAGGIAHAETVLYDGADDTGDDPNVPNSQFRGLIGYERELAPDLTGAVQYYVERILDHDRLLAASSNAAFEPSRTRHLITTRLRYRLLQ